MKKSELKKMEKCQKVSIECVKSLMDKGHTEDKATEMVINFIKESSTKYKDMGIDFILASMKMTFMDESVEKASKNLFKI